MNLLGLHLFEQFICHFILGNKVCRSHQVGHCLELLSFAEIVAPLG
jgi:hypothetical protein